MKYTRKNTASFSFMGKSTANFMLPPDLDFSDGADIDPAAVGEAARALKGSMVHMPGMGSGAVGGHPGLRRAGMIAGGAALAGGAVAGGLALRQRMMQKRMQQEQEGMM